MWLPPAPAPRDLDGLDEWKPAALGPDPDCTGLVYIVVDELHEGIAGLVVSPWPRMDERRRLVFGDEAASTRVAAPADALLALLRAERSPVVTGGVDDPMQADALRARPVAIGDVYAARTLGTPGDGDPGVWLAPPVLDLTGPAREAVKAQTSAALSGAMSADYLAAVAREMGEPD